MDSATETATRRNRLAKAANTQSGLTARRGRWALGLAAVAAVMALLIGKDHFSQTDDYRAAMLGGDYSTAETLLRPLAEAGDVAAQNSLGNIYYLGLIPERRYEDAAEMYLKAALNGNTDAQVNLSQLYQYGLGVPLDYFRAYAWLTHARRLHHEGAENLIRWAPSRLKLTVAQMQFVRKKYKTLASLDPDKDRELE